MASKMNLRVGKVEVTAYYRSSPGETKAPCKYCHKPGVIIWCQVEEANDGGKDIDLATPFGKKVVAAVERRVVVPVCRNHWSRHIREMDC